MTTTGFRTIWLSDVHLGTKDCKAEFLLDFLESTRCEHLYLVGDLIDLWKMKGDRWPESHARVLRAIMAKAAAGTRVVYVPGNHDDPLRDYAGLWFGRIAIHRQVVHRTRDGRRLLVIHGDEFDELLRCPALLNWIGELSYDALMALSRWVDSLRRQLGRPYWSLAQNVKQRIDRAVHYIGQFEAAAAREAARRGLDGVVCGHIHKAALRSIDGVLYCNDGDWVESCTALVEHEDGRLEILHWGDAAIVVHRETEIPPLPRAQPVRS